MVKIDKKWCYFPSKYPSDPGKYAHNKHLFGYVKKVLVSTKRLVYKSKLQYNPL